MSQMSQVSYCLKKTWAVQSQTLLLFCFWQTHTLLAHVLLQTYTSLCLHYTSLLEAASQLKNFGLPSLIFSHRFKIHNFDLE